MIQKSYNSIDWIIITKGNALLAVSTFIQWHCLKAEEWLGKAFCFEVGG
jgi:hypothetical protein